eukprot:9012339-Lingulodinium_polyedra.AAC.1
MALGDATRGVVLRRTVRRDPADCDAPRQDPGPQRGPEVGVLPLRGVRPVPHAHDAVTDIPAVREQ